jgi:hypothetical protein
MDYSCTLCDRYFGSKAALEQHEQNSPVHTKKITCETCNRCFGSKEALEQHRQTSPVHTKTILCETCNRCFGSNEALEQHRQTSPVHKKSFHCQNCNCFVGSNKALKKHKRQFELYGKCSEDQPAASWDADALSYALARFSILDTPAPAVQRHAQALVPANPITTTTLSKKAKTNVFNPKQETKEFFTFPALNANIADAVAPEITYTWFNEDSDDDDFNNEYDTFVMGRFMCNNNACKRQSWISGKVYIEIRGFDYNGYSAVVYNQRCRSCDFLGTFVLDEQSYIERVAYRLKKWAGVAVAQPYYKVVNTPQHEQDFCEGCKRGKCEAGGSLALY